MEKKTFEVLINVPREKVWSVLWEDDTYRKWTRVFSEGSYAVSNWEEGDDIEFLSPEKDGMYSKIDKKIPNEYMSFRHVGEIRKGERVPVKEGGENWTGALENYTLTNVDGKTELKVEIDMVSEHADYFEKTFPVALEKVKELAEAD